jgi:excisionase family DNA binding protein
MTDKRHLSPKELAHAIGVSESSLKRWADDGRIRVARTAGGHRRIPIAEAVRFIRQSDVSLERPEVLGMEEIGRATHELPAGPVDDQVFFDALIEGDAALARGMILSQYLGGASLAEIFDGPMRSALHRIGELWQHDESGIFVEHRATDICLQSLHQLRGLLPPSAHGSPVAVGGAPPQDIYQIPTLMVAITLGEVGWDAINLGPELPLPILSQAIDHYRASLTWLSFSNYDRSAPADTEVVGWAETLGIPLVLGGQALQRKAYAAHEHIEVIGSMAELGAFAKGVLATISTR